MRDDFAIPVKETLAKRVAQRCSRPECRQATSGPQEDPAKAINVGVAAHIIAASLGGPRYDDSLTPERRQAIENGVWLCQTCAKLIDNDPLRYTCEVLHEWKREAEKTARRDLEQKIAPQDHSVNIFKKLEKLMPNLFSEMRIDLKEHPLRREFVLLKKNWMYWAGGDELYYYFDDHAELEGMIYILLNHNLINGITFNKVARYVMTEELVDYLNGS